MKFLALLSGGKDSCYNIVKCTQYGHELVCLANLTPPSSFEGEELNSFMYQSAAYSIIPLMAECFDVPLFRRAINGSAVNQHLEYEPSENDEVEDLYQLIKEIKDAYPDIQGVSCGAIVSNYQRFRVENICNRLGLTPLTYLWQRDRPTLLDEMVNSGIHAVLVKVAGAGLEPHKHLGKSLAELQPTFTRLNAKYGLDVCGEGGEYESIVLDCSAFKRRLVIDTSEVVVDDEDASVGNLKITSCRSEAKEGTAVEGAERTTAAGDDGCQKPTSLFAALTALAATADVPSDGSAELRKESSTVATSQKMSLQAPLPRLTTSSIGYGQSELIHPVCGMTACGQQNDRNVVKAQLRDILTRLSESLRRVGATLADVVFVHLYIASMSLFGPVNEEYCRWFGKHPPSRSCVAVSLPLGVTVALDAVYLKGSHRAVNAGQFHKRNVLHVQSMSEWAPLCIGPYSQANVIRDCLVYVSGQIPLNPATMTLLSADASDESAALQSPVEAEQSLLRAQLALCCQHAARALQVVESSLRSSLTCTVYVNTSVLPSGSEPETQTETTEPYNRFAWIQRLVSHLLHVNYTMDAKLSARAGSADNDYDDYGDDDKSDCGSEDSDNSSNNNKAPRVVPVLVVGVCGLPRDALVEVEVAAFRCDDVSHNTKTDSPLSDRLRHLEAIAAGGDNLAGVCSDVLPASDVESVVNSWPLWGGDGCHAPPTECAWFAANHTATDGCYHSTASFTSFSRSICAGFCSVSLSQAVSSSDSGAAATAPAPVVYIDIDAAVASMVHALSAAFQAAQIDPKLHLHTLRVYYQPELLDERQLQAALCVCLVRGLGIKSLPVLCVPVTKFDGENCVLAAQFTALDFVQLESEAWIHRS